MRNLKLLTFILLSIAGIIGGLYSTVTLGLEYFNFIPDAGLDNIKLILASIFTLMTAGAMR